MCPLHSEVKRPKRQSVEQRLIGGTSNGHEVAYAQKPQFYDAIPGEIFIGKIWGEGYSVCDSLLMGWWVR